MPPTLFPRYSFASLISPSVDQWKPSPQGGAFWGSLPGGLLPLTSCAALVSR